jgi:hypothetical protein
MFRRRWLILTVTVLGLAVATNVYLFVARRPAWRINKSNFLHIERGMTVEEVSRILGAPPGDYTVFERPNHTGFIVRPCDRLPGNRVVRHPSVQWCGDDGTILLRLKDGKVTLRLFHGHVDGDDLFPDHEAFVSGRD